MKKFLLLLLMLAALPLARAQKTVTWEGYTQLRASTDFNGENTVMVRRLKFRLKSTPQFSDRWSYKIQVLFTGWMQERFFLQDAKINYKNGLFSFDFGQFVPRYSLQWTQPDYNIPSIERAVAVNILHPDGLLGVRDLGLQVNFHTKNHLLQTGIGLFNGYGIKEYRFDNQGFMASHKTAVNIPLPKNKLQFGYSLMYRKARQLQLKKILPDTLIYSGNDVRYNLFARFQSQLLEVQAEYLNAAFDDGRNAHGYYFLSAVNIKKSQIVLAVENYQNTYSPAGSPFYRLGYNYLINKNKIKLFVDNYFQITGGQVSNYYASVQMQLFFR